MKPHNTSRLSETEPTMGRVSLGPIFSESSGQRKLKLDPSIHLTEDVVIAVDLFCYIYRIVETCPTCDPKHICSDYIIIYFLLTISGENSFTLFFDCLHKLVSNVFIKFVTSIIIASLKQQLYSLGREIKGFIRNTVVPTGNILTIGAKIMTMMPKSLRTNQPRIDLPKTTQNQYLRCASQKARSHQKLILTYES